MNSRYNPHALARAAREWAGEPGPPPGGGLAVDLQWRAGAWQGTPRWSDPHQVPLPIAGPLLAEYGVDAARLAVLAAGTAPPDLPLLESAHRWLAAFHAAMRQAPDAAGPWAEAAGGPQAVRKTEVSRHSRCRPGGSPADLGPVGTSPTETWNVDPWLVAAGEAMDHGPGRGRWYPALAAVRKAWNLAPATAATPAPGRALILGLVAPFAPLLGRFLLEESGGWPPPPLGKLTAAFPGRRAVRLAFERGGWTWVAVEAAAFRMAPEPLVANIPWVARAVAGQPWRLEESPEGWKVCLNRPRPSAGSSRS